MGAWLISGHRSPPESTDCCVTPQSADPDESAALLHQQQWKWRRGGGGEEKRSQKEGKRLLGNFQSNTAEYSTSTSLSLSLHVVAKCNDTIKAAAVPYHKHAQILVSFVLKRGTGPIHKDSQPPAKPEKPKSRGFRNTLKSLRDRLRTDHKSLVRQIFRDGNNYVAIIWLISGSNNLLCCPVLRLQLRATLWSRGDTWSTVTCRVSLSRSWTLSAHRSARPYKVLCDCSAVWFSLVHVLCCSFNVKIYIFHVFHQIWAPSWWAGCRSETSWGQSRMPCCWRCRIWHHCDIRFHILSRRGWSCDSNIIGIIPQSSDIPVSVGLTGWSLWSVAPWHDSDFFFFCFLQSVFFRCTKGHFDPQTVSISWYFTYQKGKPLEKRMSWGLSWTGSRWREQPYIYMSFCHFVWSDYSLGISYRSKGCED